MNSKLFRLMPASAAVAAALLAVPAARAITVVPVTHADGSPFLEFHVMKKGEELDGTGSAANFTAKELREISSAAKAWSEYLGGKTANRSPVPVTFFKNTEENASAVSGAPDDWSPDRRGYTAFAGALQRGWKATDEDSAVILGTALQITTDYEPRHVTKQTEAAALMPVMFHEFGHALGITNQSWAEDDEDEDEDAPAPREFVPGTMSAFATHLRDMHGTPAKEGLKIVHVTDDGLDYDSVTTEEARKDKSGKVFYAGDDDSSGVTFKGTNVDEVLRGSPLAGVPVNGFEMGEDSKGRIDYAPDLAHLEMRNSMMSHQEFRNYNTFLEAELAVLQDIGYKIDRRNFYGASVYADGQTITNRQGFFARDAKGAAYLEGVPNTSTYGAGLHVYGSGNTITQAADLLADGAGAVGIRIDGSGNSVTLEKGRRVTANGSNGMGVAVAWGHGHKVRLEGDVEATGKAGIGLSFDIGGNVVEEADVRRGSYLSTSGTDRETLSALNGPLVDTASVAGSLRGTEAIHIGALSYVKQVNIEEGASVSGPIVSEWDPEALRRMPVAKPDGSADGPSSASDGDALLARLGARSARMEEVVEESDAKNYIGAPEGDPLTTRLLFGADASGRPQGGFSMEYAGDIRGKSIDMAVSGGELSYGGTARVNSVTVEKGATLSGSGSLEAENGVTNHGTVSPAGKEIGSMSVSRDYVQTGALDVQAKLDSGTASVDKLKVAGKSTFAEGSEINVTFEPGFIGEEGAVLPLGSFVESGSGAEGLGNAQLSVSGLGDAFTVTREGDDIVISRTGYSAAAGADGNSVAAALDASAGSATDEAKAIYTGLDFGGAGSLASDLSSLSASLYNDSAKAAVAAGRFVTHTLERHQATPRAPGAEAFLIPMGGRLTRGTSQETRSTYGGLLSGAQKTFPAAGGTLTAGGFAAFLHHSDRFTGTGGSRSVTEGVHLGAHARYSPGSVPGLWAFGVVRGAVENTTMKRTVRAGGYSARTKAQWTSPQANLAAGIGHDFRITESLSAGPQAWIDYLALRRKAVTETGGAAALRVGGQTLQSLRGSVGARASWTPSPAAELQARVLWNHEFMSRGSVIRARFADWGARDFTEDKAGTDPNTVSAGVAFSLRPAAGWAVAAEAGMERGRDTHGAWGSLRVDWQF